MAGEMLLNYDGTVNGTVLDSDYVPDELDVISADAAADGMIYSLWQAQCGIQGCREICNIRFTSNLFCLWHERSLCK